MFSLKNSMNQIISKTLTSLIGFLFIDSKIRNPKKGKMVNIPSDFTPVIRFIVLSDIHLDSDESQKNAVRLREMFNDMYSYSDSSEKYKALDAVIVAGDFTGNGDEAEYIAFNRIVNEAKRDETELLCVLGNHEFIKYRDEDASVGYDVFKKHISENVDVHKIINGFHFIGVSYDNDGKRFINKIQWLKAQLDIAVKDGKNKPVFVFQHPHPFATVYGSINWSDINIRRILSKYPSVVDFSGHSHYSPSDPRSVWQGAFTAVGCGSLAAFMGNLNYIDGDKDAPGESAGYWVAEADKCNNVKLRLYDAVNRRFFDNVQYYFSDFGNLSSRNYTWHKQKSLDTKPVFPENANIAAHTDDEKNVIITFPDAIGFYEAENYKIIVKNSEGKTVYQQTVISDYVRSGHNGVNVNIGKLSDGEYKIRIDAFSPYAKKGGRISGIFSI